jgi:hypothetical protein
LHIFAVGVTSHSFRDRSLFIVQGGIEEKLGGPLHFLNLTGGALKKYREMKEGGLLKYLLV